MEDTNDEVSGVKPLYEPIQRENEQRISANHDFVFNFGHETKQNFSESNFTKRLCPSLSGGELSVVLF